MWRIILKLILINFVMILSCWVFTQANESSYVGVWDSSINNLLDHPKTIALRIQVLDSITRIPIRGARVFFKGNFVTEYRNSRHPSGEQKAQMEEFEISAITGGDGIVIAAFDWQKDYPWQSGVDEIEKIQMIQVIRNEYFFVEHRVPFQKIFSVEEGGFEEFRNLWEKECSGQNVKLCTLKLNEFSQEKIFEKIHREEWGIVYQEPVNLMRWKDGSLNLHGPYLIYNIKIYMSKLNIDKNK